MAHLVERLHFAALRKQGQKCGRFDPAHLAPESGGFSLVHGEVVAAVEKGIIRHPAASPQAHADRHGHEDIEAGHAQGIRRDQTLDHIHVRPLCIVRCELVN